MCGYLVPLSCCSFHCSLIPAPAGKQTSPGPARDIYKQRFVLRCRIAGIFGRSFLPDREKMRKGHDFVHSKRQIINNSFDMGRPKAVVLSELAELFAEAKNR